VQSRDVKVGDVKEGDVKVGDVKVGDVKVGDLKVGDVKDHLDERVLGTRLHHRASLSIAFASTAFASVNLHPCMRVRVCACR
jgi:hypothetical protein